MISYTSTVNWITCPRELKSERFEYLVSKFGVSKPFTYLRMYFLNPAPRHITDYIDRGIVSMHSLHSSSFLPTLCRPAKPILWFNIKLKGPRIRTSWRFEDT